MSKENTFEKLHNIALNAPKTSGVYLWKNEDGLIIYVGKAKSLRSRLASYFVGGKDIKTRLLVASAYSLEYIKTQNEYEALLLENTLIKTHSPKYNISLKDGKTYPMLKLTNEPFPRLYRTRNIHNDGSKYFGPFPNVNNVDVFLDMVKNNYKLHQCKVVRKRRLPCLYYHIGRCDAPCCGKITEEEYNKSIKEITSILAGNTKAIIKKLEAEMKEAVKEENFEKATTLRNNIEAVMTISDKTIVQDLDLTARDYIAWASSGAMITFAVLKMRGGRLVGRDLYRAETLKTDSEAMLEFFMSYYSDPATLPPNIFILAAEDCQLAQEWLTKELNAKVSLFTSLLLAEEVGCSDVQYENAFVASSPKAMYNAKTGEGLLIDNNFNKKESRHHYAALEMARFNAKEDITARLRETGDFPALQELKEIAHCKDLPYIIEGFDIAHLQGHFTVAGMVYFRNGKPDKKNYRIFKLRNTDGIIDDYSSMKEAVARRYTRLINENSELPDLILIDGGIGQVNVASKILKTLGLDIPLIGLAEKNEEIYFPGNSTPLVLPRRSYALRLLQRVRDEVHHFSNTRVSKLNNKAKTTSIFEKLPHIGKKRAGELLKRFSSIEALGQADIEEIRTCLHVSEAQAEEIRESCRKALPSGEVDISP
ncbi:MAG: excinuclease ABC subunit UvrC [Treponema sp.]